MQGLNGPFEQELGGGVVQGSRTQWEPGLAESVGICVYPLGIGVTATHSLGSAGMTPIASCGMT